MKGLNRRLARRLLQLCASLSLAVPLAAQQRNLVLNPDFEDNSAAGKIPSWSIGYFSPYPQKAAGEFPKALIDKENKASGNQALKIITRQNEDQVILETAVPVAAGKTYRISCMYKNNGSILSIRENHIDQNGRHNPTRYKSVLEVKSDNDWKLFEGKIGVMPDDARVGLTFFVGLKPGELWLDDVRIEPLDIKLGDEVRFRMTPSYYTDDNVYHLPQGDPMILFLTVCNEAQYQAKEPRIIVELPEGVELLGSDYDSHQFAPPEAFERDGIKYNRYDHTMGLPDIVLRNVDFNRTSYGSTILLVKSSLPPSDKILDGCIYLQDGDFKCAPCAFRIRVAPAVQEAHAPKRFRTGIFCETSVEFYGKPLEDFASFYKNCGFNEIIIPETLRTGSRNPAGKQRNPEPIIRKMKEKGLRVQVATNSLVDGYVIRYTPFTKQVPASARIRNAAGSIVEPDSFDPAYIYRRGEWYLKCADFAIDKILKMGADDIWSNWEPWMFVAEKGSFTEASMKDFAEFSGIPYDEIKSMKPIDIVSKHEDKLLSFQSWQYAKAMEVLNNIFRDKSTQAGKRIDFITAVGPNTLDYFEKGKPHWKYTRSFSGEQYLKHFDVISTWYYLFMDDKHMTDEKYRGLFKLGYRSGEASDSTANETNLGTLKTVEEKVAFIKSVREKNGEKTIPYIHLTQNLQCESWVVDPESIGLQMLASFVGGASGVGLYYFPRGYDERYWASAAAANDMIAFYEDFVFDGQKLSSGFNIKPETDLFKDKNYAGNLTWRAFEHQGKTLLAICNFDFLDKGFFRLSCENLPAGAYALHDPYRKQYYCETPGKGLSAEQLNNICLEIPAESIQFLVLEPYRENSDYGTPLLLSDIKKRSEGEVSELNKKFADRISQIKRLQEPDKAPAESFNESRVTALEQKNFSAVIEENNGVKYYKMSNGRQTVLVNPSYGATVKSWRINGREMVFGEKEVGVLCKDRFYIPQDYMNSKILSGVYQFVEHAVGDDSIGVEFKRAINTGPLAGFHLSKRFRVDDGVNGFTVRYGITNGQSESRTIGFWVFNCPEALRKDDRAQPSLRFGGSEYKDFLSGDSLFTLSGVNIAAGFENQIRNLLPPHCSPQKITTSKAELRGKNVTLTILPQQESFYSYYTWSSVKCGFVTFELLFTPFRLEPGQKWETEIRYTASE